MIYLFIKNKKDQFIISQNSKSNFIQYSQKMTSLSKNPLQKLFKTQGPSGYKQQPNSRFIKADSLYNLKDFLPTTSSQNIDQRLKTKSTVYPKTQINVNNNKYANMSVNNIEQKVLQQRMNKLKEENFTLKQKLSEEQQKSTKQAQEIQKLKQLIKKYHQKEQNKAKSLRLWNYKYHMEYIPKQKHKYELAVQTEDSYNQTVGLRAKDFQDIYKKLNSNPSTIDFTKNKSRKQSTNLKLIPDFNVQKNSSTINNKSMTLKLTKNTKQNNSLFKIPKLQDFMQSQNKQNEMYASNMPNIMLFRKNPMQINLQKMIQLQKPIREECIQIYPVEQGYLDGIIGQILCGEEQ